MATCSDCTHYDICLFHLTNHENEKCVHFVNKADVVKVAHGEWVRKDGFLVCSNCDSTKPFAVIRDEIHYFGCNYCNNCGAMMKGGEG